MSLPKISLWTLWIGASFYQGNSSSKKHAAFLASKYLILRIVPKHNFSAWPGITRGVRKGVFECATDAGLCAYTSACVRSPWVWPALWPLWVLSSAPAPLWCRCLGNVSSRTPSPAPPAARQWRWCDCAAASSSRASRAPNRHPNRHLCGYLRWGERDRGPSVCDRGMETS